MNLAETLYARLPIRAQNGICSIAGWRRSSLRFGPHFQRCLAEWERTTYATAVHYLAAAATTAADPLRGPDALRAWGAALGSIQSFKGLPADKRKITDAQIDALLAKIGATTAYRLVTSPGDRALELNQAINDIALYQGFTPAEIESFKIDH